MNKSVESIRKEMRRRIISLSPAESRIFSLIGQGLRNDDIVEQLGSSINTVRSHLKSIYRKLGITGRSILVSYATNNDLRRIRNRKGNVSIPIEHNFVPFEYNFAPAKWKRVSLHSCFDKESHLEFPGVYVLLSDNECLYVGSSSYSIASRIYFHFCKENWKQCKNGILAIRRSRYRFEELAIEARLIYKLDPKFNKRIGRMLYNNGGLDNFADFR